MLMSTTFKCGFTNSSETVARQLTQKCELGQVNGGGFDWGV